MLSKIFITRVPTVAHAHGCTRPRSHVRAQAQQTPETKEPVDFSPMAEAGGISCSNLAYLFSSILSFWGSGSPAFLQE